MVVCSPCRVRLPFRRELEHNRDLLKVGCMAWVLSEHTTT